MNEQKNQGEQQGGQQKPGQQTQKPGQGGQQNQQTQKSSEAVPLRPEEGNNPGGW
jgi:hypothetical protein